MSGEGPPRVLELAEGAAASFSARIFARMGADVVKVERSPSGDPLRDATPQFHAETAKSPAAVAFHFLNAGKKSVALDLEAERARSDLDRLFEWADVVVIDEVFAGIGVVQEAVEAAERVVVTYVTPFGLSGPYSSYQGMSGTAFALGGELFMLPGGMGYAAYPDAPPLLSRGHSAEFDGGVIGALVALAGLYADGEEVPILDVSVAEANASLNRWLVSHFDESGWIESRATRSYPYAGMFECADGYAMIQPSTEGQWTQLVEFMGRPDWALNPEYETRAQRNEAGEEIASRIREWIGTKSKHEMLDGGLVFGVPAAPFRDAAEVFSCEHFAHRGFFATYGERGEGEAPVMPDLPFQFRPFGPPSAARAPDVGEHTREMLG